MPLYPGPILQVPGYDSLVPSLCRPQYCQIVCKYWDGKGPGNEAKQATQNWRCNALDTQKQKASTTLILLRQLRDHDFCFWLLFAVYASNFWFQYLFLVPAFSTCFQYLLSVPAFSICFQYSLVPRLSWNANMYRVESLVSFLRKHDVIKIGPKQKGNVLWVVQPTMSSTLGV